MGYTKLRCGAWCCIIIGVLIMACAIAWIPLLNHLVISGAKEGAQINQANEETWKNIPGHYDILISNGHYFFNCSNSDDVIYKGVKPIYEQFGPYLYKEFDVFTDVQYVDDLAVTGISDSSYSTNVDGTKTASGMTATYNQYLVYNTDQ